MNEAIPTLLDTHQNISCFVGDVCPHLIRILDSLAPQTRIVGCVSWLTHPDLVKALARHRVSILVQKELYLRSKAVQGKRSCKAQAFSQIIQKQYATLSNGGGVRCFGICAIKNADTSPRMHHKFLVVFNETNEDDSKPEFVWTGSFNFTKNATLSRENALWIRDSNIAQTYYSEWQQLYAYSEPLDWASRSLILIGKREGVELN